MRVPYDDDDDVDDLLRRMPAPGVPPRARERHLELLRAAMAEDDGGVPEAEPGSRPVVPIRPSRRRRVTIAVVAAAAVGLAGTAAATLVWQHATNRSEIRCFPKVVTDYDNPRYGDTTFIGADSATQALEICSAEWSQGIIVSTFPYVGEPTSVPQPVPPLVACVLPNGEVGVFPTTQTCEELGLPRSSG